MIILYLLVAVDCLSSPQRNSSAFQSQYESRQIVILGSVILIVQCLSAKPAASACCLLCSRKAFLPVDSVHCCFRSSDNPSYTCPRPQHQVRKLIPEHTKAHKTIASCDWTSSWRLKACKLINSASPSTCDHVYIANNQMQQSCPLFIINSSNIYQSEPVTLYIGVVKQATDL